MNAARVVVVSTTGFTAQETARIVHAVEASGRCRYEPHLTLRTSILVVKVANSAKHEAAKKKGITTVSEDWLTDGHCDPDRASEFPVPPLQGLLVSCTSLSPQ